LSIQPMICGNCGINQSLKVWFDVFPMRNQTITGPGSDCCALMGKSSSLVIITASLARAYFQISSSSASRKPTSRTALASCPASRSQRATAGGNCASTRNFTGRQQARGDQAGRLRIRGWLGCPPAPSRDNQPGFRLQEPARPADPARPSRECACHGYRDVRRIVSD
jgi:hypothetical protein